MLKSIAIQGGQDPSRYRIYTPSSERNWRIMMFALNCADLSYMEMITHLGRTHLLIEPFVVATNNMNSKHPIAQLVLPMLQGTAFINQEAVSVLLQPEGAFETIIMTSLESIFNLTIAAVQSPGFNKLMLPVELSERGMLDSPVQYPFRDDALKLWNATALFMKEYVDLFYADDTAVKNDVVLQTWSTTLASENGGRVKGFGEDGSTGVILTKGYLVDVLTMIQFTAGCMHAAVNFPQKAYASYTPLAPGSGVKDISDAHIDSFEVITEMLPHPYAAANQIQTASLLGEIYYTQYGNYGVALTKSLPQTKTAIANFQSNLKQIEVEINAREAKATFPYTFLLPSNIPLSINI